MNPGNRNLYKVDFSEGYLGIPLRNSCSFHLKHRLQLTTDGYIEFLNFWAPTSTWRADIWRISTSHPSFDHNSDGDLDQREPATLPLVAYSVQVSPMFLVHQSRASINKSLIKRFTVTAVQHACAVMVMFSHILLILCKLTKFYGRVTLPRMTRNFFC